MPGEQPVAACAQISGGAEKAAASRAPATGGERRSSQTRKAAARTGAATRPPASPSEMIAAEPALRLAPAVNAHGDDGETIAKPREARLPRTAPTVQPYHNTSSAANSTSRQHKPSSRALYDHHSNSLEAQTSHPPHPKNPHGGGGTSHEYTQPHEGTRPDELHHDSPIRPAPNPRKDASA